MVLERWPRLLKVVDVAVIERDGHGVAQESMRPHGSRYVTEVNHVSTATQDLNVFGEVSRRDTQTPRVGRRLSDPMVHE